MDRARGADRRHRWLLGPVDVFWALARRFLPDHAERLERYAGSIGCDHEGEVLRAAYEDLTAANFSRAVLAHAHQLAVVPVSGSGWCDWGSPEWVLASLAGTESHTRLLARMHPASSDR